MRKPVALTLLVLSTQLACAFSLAFAPAASAQDARPLSPTILPTDIVPLPAPEERQTFGETFKLKTLQFLPAKFYFTGSVESSFRNETNIFQSVKKRQVINGIRNTYVSTFYSLTPNEQAQVLQPVNQASIDDNVFRVFPNLTAGWAFTKRTRVFANYFLIRDGLFHHPILNTTIQSVGGGLQHDFPLGKRANLQLNLQWRELFQNNQIPVFDYLPGATFSYLITPRTVAYASALLQMRGKQPFVSPTREIDPFYTFGFLYQKGMWTFSSAATFLQNFREPFRRNALIPINNYSWILDFEVDRQLFKKVPGLQAFLRAEPIYNFHSRSTTGLSGMDFRFFYGLRMSFGKPPLTAAIEQLREQLDTPAPSAPPPKPTSKLPAPPNHRYVAHHLQPIHGLIAPDQDKPETTIVPEINRLERERAKATAITKLNSL